MKECREGRDSQDVRTDCREGMARPEYTKGRERTRCKEGS